MLVNKSIHDTQTGLRAIPRKLLPGLLKISSSRYEYELDMLIYTIQNKFTVEEIPINTIYIDGNHNSHFNPIIDSLKIYFVFLRYIMGSLSSAFVDFFAFVILHFISKNLLLSLGLARIISASFNFLISKKIIFKSNIKILSAAHKYLLLALCSFSMTYLLLFWMVNDLNLNLYSSKIIADISIFCINFLVQRSFIFPASNRE